MNTTGDPTNRSAGVTARRDAYGATSTILTEYLQESKLEIEPKIATALFYGISAEHPDFPRLKELFRAIDTRRGRWASRRRVEPALAEIEVILRRRVGTFSATESASPRAFSQPSREATRKGWRTEPFWGISSTSCR